MNDPAPSGRPPLESRAWLALASATDALHYHATNTLPKHLKLKLPDGGVAKLRPPNWHHNLRRAAAGSGGEKRGQQFGLPPLNHAAVQAAVAVAASLLVTNSRQLVAQLQQLHERHISGDAASGRRGLFPAAPWKKLVGGRFQQHRRGVPRNAAGHAAKAEQFQKACDPQAAIPLLEEALKLNPTNVDLLVLIAKQWSDSSFLDHWPDKEKVPANQKAMDYSQQAITADPKNAMGYVASCMSKGRLAYWSKDNKQKIHLAKEAQDEVFVALQLDPNNDLAHHLMGRWHYEMAQLNFVVRSLVRVLYGTNFMPGSVQDALASYQRAVDLKPGRLVHRVELGRMQMKLGNDEGALENLQTALRLEVEDVNSLINKREALNMLHQVERRLKRYRQRSEPASASGLPWKLSKNPLSLALPAFGGAEDRGAGGSSRPAVPAAS